VGNNLAGLFSKNHLAGKFQKTFRREQFQKIIGGNCFGKNILAGNLKYFFHFENSKKCSFFK
jgi:thiamine transporter ThiT